MRYRRDEVTGERQGVSFRWDNGSFKGSRVDPSFSLGGLERTLALQEELRLSEERRVEKLREEGLRLGGLGKGELGPEGQRQGDLLQENLQQEALRQEQGLRHGMRHRF